MQWRMASLLKMEKLLLCTKSLIWKKMNLGMKFCTKKCSRLTSGILARKAGIWKENASQDCVACEREYFCIRPQYCWKKGGGGAILCMHTINYSWWWAEKVIARSHHNVDSKVLLLLLPMKNGDLMSSRYREFWNII